MSKKKEFLTKSQMEAIRRGQVINVTGTNFVVTNSGVQGDWSLIQPERVQSMLGSDDLIQKAEVLDVGPLSPCSIGDVVIVKDWLIERIKIGDTVTYYAPAQSILHIL